MLTHADISRMEAAAEGRHSNVVVRFERIAVQNQTKTDLAGSPQFDDVDFIEKRVPGDRLNVVFRPVEPEDLREFGAAYKHWKETQEDPKSGTPLKEWPPIARSQAEALIQAHVRTVEELAGLSEDNCKRIGAGVLGLQQKAKAFLEVAKGTAPISKLTAELEREKREKEALQQQVAAMQSAIEELQKKQARGGK